MTLRERTLENLKKRRQNLIDGGINSIPSPFERFGEDFIGIEMATYYCITSTTKGGKSQLGSFLFIFLPILYSFTHPDQASVRVFYFVLEETPERVLQRFMSYLLFYLSGGEIRISPRDLRSSKNDKPVPEEVLELLSTEEYDDILAYFEECIEFSTTSNPTGIYKECKKFAEANGTSYFSEGSYFDDMGKEVHTRNFTHYIPNDPKLYKICFVDHIGLIDTERGMTLKQAMDKLSEYLAKYLRNWYGFTTVIIQQQSFENESNDNFTTGKIRPSAQGLGDSKYIARDCNVLLGIFSPFKFELPEYKGYDITKFKDNIRFFEVLLNRDGEMGGLCPLFFDGAVCNFSELPLPHEKEQLDRIYEYLDKIRAGEPTSIT